MHTILRSGQLDHTFAFLASSSLAVQLSTASDAPNLSAYGHYLSARLKAYANLKRDVIRDKSDRRAAGRLRKLGVEQGLLREVREVQRMIAALVESKFFLDDVDDEVSMTALRLLVKDLLVLFTAVNEGVINVLEHYFEMSHPDATTALKIYKTFCRDTEKVVAYLGVAKKLQNVLNVPIPNLKHAPVSLVGSLEEYLNDPNFAKNREEYKENKRIADGGQARDPATPAPTPSTSAVPPPASSAVPAAAAPAAAPTSQPAGQQGSFTDFFASIEAAQTPMFNPVTNSPSVGYFQQQAGFNPFLAPQQTGAPSPFGAFPTGAPFQQPQMTGFQGPGPNPFGLAPQQTGFIQPQQTGFIQPQQTGYGQVPVAQAPMMTGANPFRQSMMPHQTGMSPFGMMPQQQQQLGSPFSQPQQQQSPFRQSAFINPQPVQPQPTGLSPFGNMQRTTSPAPFGGPPTSPAPNPFGPARTGSAFGNPPSRQLSASSPGPLTQQKTGARNPFNPAPGEVPAPKPPQGPSMNALAWQSQQQQQQQPQPQQQQQTGNPFGQPQQQQSQPTGPFGQPQPQQPQQSGFGNSFSSGPFGQSNAHGASSPFGQPQQQNPTPLASQKTGGLMADIASEFAFGGQNNGQSSANTPQTNAPTSAFSTLSVNSTANNAGAPFGGSSFSNSSFSASTPAPLSSQPTGFGGSSVRAFQPTSAFGSQLAGELGGAGPGSSFSSFSSSAPAPAPAQQPQPTGFNPFRGSTLPPLGANLGGMGAPSALSAQPTGMRAAFVPSSDFGAGLVGQHTGVGGGAQRQGSLF